MKDLLPARNKKGHKGTFGTVAIFGGQINDDYVMTGSPAFAAKAALRSGAGLVNFYAEEDVLLSLIKMVPQAVGVKNISKGWDSVVIGPGLETSKHNALEIEKILKLKIPTVIDAGGIDILAKNPGMIRLLHDQCVLTPHPKELKRLLEGLEIKNADQLASNTGACLVLKDSTTTVLHRGKKWQLEGDNPVLATGGTGDVLAGLIGGLLAQYADAELSIFNCVKAAIYVHLNAANIWRDNHGSQGLMIDELLELIPQQIEKLRKN